MKVFVQTWSKVSKASGNQLFKKIAMRYSEDHRHYHTLAHVAYCLAELSQLNLDERSRTMIELAIWFHDVVYDVYAKNNELKSAEYFQEVALQAKVDPSLIKLVTEMIKATQLHEIPSGQDTPELRTFLDIDLSILGAHAEQFQEYDDGIRKEYNWISSTVYNSKRKKVLQYFLNRTPLFFTKEFTERYEACARANIKCLLKKLGCQNSEAI